MYDLMKTCSSQSVLNKEVMIITFRILIITQTCSTQFLQFLNTLHPVA